MFQSFSIFIFLPVSQYCEVPQSLKEALLKSEACPAGGRGVSSDSVL